MFDRSSTLILIQQNAKALELFNKAVEEVKAGVSATSLKKLIEVMHDISAAVYSQIASVASLQQSIRMKIDEFKSKKPSRDEIAKLQVCKARTQSKLFQMESFINSLTAQVHVSVTAIVETLPTRENLYTAEIVALRSENDNIFMIVENFKLSNETQNIITKAISNLSTEVRTPCCVIL